MVGAGTDSLMGGMSQAFGGFSGILNGLMVIPIFIAVAVGFLFMYRNSKFVYPVLVYRDYGNGKAGFKQVKAGKFKKNRVLFNMIDVSGEIEIITSDNRKIYEASDVDMMEINGKRGFICYQKPDDPLILIPITQCKPGNSDMVFDIAPADLRDTAVKIVKESEREMLSGLEKIIPYVSFIIVGIILFICVIVTLQFAQRMHDSAIEGSIKLLQESRNLANTPPASPNAP